jgi:hypothetical protein
MKGMVIGTLRIPIEVYFVIYYSPIWVAVAFIAVAAVRRQVTTRALLAFTAAEALAIWMAMGLWGIS